MHFEYSYMLEDGLEVLAALISGLPVTFLNLAGYVLTALALYALAQRRGIRHGWMAWVPVLNCWILGSLSDQYRYLVKGEYRSKRKGLLAMCLINTALVFVVTVLAIVAVVVIGVNAASFAPALRPDAMGQLAGLGIAVVFVALAIGIISIAITVVRFIALSDIYRSMDPENATLFLVLSILFPVTEPFFLFFNRKKELGMPPRREAAPQPESREPETKDYL